MTSKLQNDRRVSKGTQNFMVRELRQKLQASLITPPPRLPMSAATMDAELGLSDRKRRNRLTKTDSRANYSKVSKQESFKAPKPRDTKELKTEREKDRLTSLEEIVYLSARSYLITKHSLCIWSPDPNCIRPPWKFCFIAANRKTQYEVPLGFV
jgi:hypothetical protein